MSIEIALENSMTLAIYSALGQTVTYTTATGPAEFKVILDNPDTDFGADIEVQAADSDVTARVRKATITQPVRGDTITDANAKIYYVDSVRRLNESEWICELRRTNG